MVIFIKGGFFMSYYVPICLVLALFGTILVNPMLYIEIFKQRKAHRKALAEATCKYDFLQLKENNYTIFDCGVFSFGLVVGQSILFTLTFIVAIFFLYFDGPVAVRWSTVFAYLWIPAFAQFLNWAYFDEGRSSLRNSLEEAINTISLILLIIFIVIPIGIACHKSIYNSLHPFDAITIMEENYEDCPSVDVTSLFGKANLAEGSFLRLPVCRNGHWIYPVCNDNSSAKSSGYFVVYSDGKREFVPKEIAYSPWIDSIHNNTDFVARREMPSTVLFGDSVFEIEPETGDVYFCKFYGDYECFRAGRKVEGALLINAATGDVEKYPLDEIPDWVTGISF